MRTNASKWPTGSTLFSLALLRSLSSGQWSPGEQQELLARRVQLLRYLLRSPCYTAFTRCACLCLSCCDDTLTATRSAQNWLSCQVGSDCATAAAHMYANAVVQAPAAEGCCRQPLGTWPVQSCRVCLQHD